MASRSGDSGDGRAARGKSFRGLVARLRSRHNGARRPRLDQDTLRRLNAPAKLVVWKGSGTEEGVTYDTLKEALRHLPAANGATDERTFIITESGHILRPVQIASLQNLLQSLEA